MVSNVWALEEAKLKDITYLVSNDEYTFMKEQKTITFICNGNERLFVLRKLITMFIRLREPQVIQYKQYVKNHNWWRLTTI